MGLLRARGKVYRPASDVDLTKGSNETYTQANVKAPRVAGLLVKIFVWILESRILGPIALYMLKKDNLIHKFVSFAEIEEPPVFTPTHNTKGAVRCMLKVVPILLTDVMKSIFRYVCNIVSEHKEQEVNLVKLDLSPAERVHEVVDCLPARVEVNLNGPTSEFRRWTIRDYSRAYNSGETTPLEVAKQFLAAVKESSGPDLRMAFFIDYNEQDILRQAAESSVRYEKGSRYIM